MRIYADALFRAGFQAFCVAALACPLAFGQVSGEKLFGTETSQGVIAAKLPDSGAESNFKVAQLRSLTVAGASDTLICVLEEVEKGRDNVTPAAGRHRHGGTR